VSRQAVPHSFQHRRQRLVRARGAIRTIRKIRLIRIPPSLVDARPAEAVEDEACSIWHNIDTIIVLVLD
jgi:hypothetical protein